MFIFPPLSNISATNYQNWMMYVEATGSNISVVFGGTVYVIKETVQLMHCMQNIRTSLMRRIWMKLSLPHFISSAEKWKCWVLFLCFQV